MAQLLTGELGNSLFTEVLHWKCLVVSCIAVVSLVGEERSICYLITFILWNISIRWSDNIGYFSFAACCPIL